MRLPIAAVFAFMILYPASAADKPQFPVVRWSGVIEDPEKEKAKPKDDIITNQKELALLWKQWREKEEPPLIDFATHFVLVKTLENRKLSFVHYSTDTEAALTYTFTTEADKAGVPKLVPGFGYAVAVIPREKVKSYKGKPLPDSK
jgi:hypothetical protein